MSYEHHTDLMSLPLHYYLSRESDAVDVDDAVKVLIDAYVHNL